MRKTIIITILIIIILAGAGYFFRSWFFKTKPETTVSPPGLPVSGPINISQPAAEAPPASASATIAYASLNQVFDYFYNSDGSYTAIQPDGRIVKTRGNQSESLSEAVLALRTAEFSLDGQKVLVNFGDTKPQFSIFDLNSKTWQPLDVNFTAVDWSPAKNNQIVYLKNLGAESNLEILDLTQKTPKPRNIIKIAVQDLQLNWLTDNQVFLFEKSSSRFLGSVFFVDLNKKTIKPVFQKQLGLTTLWNPITDQGLALISNPNYRGGQLSLINQRGDWLRRFNFLTLPSKCAFSRQSTSSLFCAVPRDVQKLNISQLPDDYEKKALYTVDDFYKIDLANNQFELIFSPKESFDAKSLKIINNRLIFINRYDQKLYEIETK